MVSAGRIKLLSAQGNSVKQSMHKLISEDEARHSSQDCGTIQLAMVCQKVWVRMNSVVPLIFSSSSRPTWSIERIVALFELPFTDLLFQAQTVHRQHFDPTQIQLSTLVSIKTGGCPEDCSYCPQSRRYSTSVEDTPMMSLDEVLEKARQAKAAGASRFCMGAAWRGPKQKDLDPVLDMVREVKALGLETCATLGLLKENQAEQLKEAGLDYYNHNLDTAPEFYGQIIKTREYQDRLNTLQRVRGAGINVSCGGILGMGESRRERAGLLAQLANLNPYPESVPINQLVPVEGTPLAHQEKFDVFEFVRTIAVARITMPKAWVRLSAGRQKFSEAEQALCFFAGANSIFYGEKLLTTDNPEVNQDQVLLDKLGFKPVGATSQVTL